MRNDRVAFIIASLFFGGLLFLVLTNGLFEKIIPQEAESTYTEVHSITFEGKKTFWTDKRNVRVNTDDGDFIYRVKDLEFALVKDDMLRLKTTEYEVFGNPATSTLTLEMGNEQLKKIRTDYTQQFSQNINVKDDE